MKFEVDPVRCILNARLKTVGLSNFGYFAMLEGEGKEMEGGAMKKSDGCTGFPDGYWVDCCEEHDLSYEQGGSWRFRRRADRRLQKCVQKKVYERTGSPFKAVFLSRLMYLGVRIGASPWCLPLYLWPRWRKRARWGFGAK